MRSTNRGVTWTQLGHICMHDPTILSVDPTALPYQGGVALYFVDMKLLQQPASVQRIIYRATSSDGVSFDTPQAVLTASTDMVDPAVVRTPDGRVRLYVPTTLESGEMALLSAVSDDGVTFTRETGTRNVTGGMPGALLLADGRARIFVHGTVATNQPGILSAISDDGLSFTQESGLRIPAAGPATTDLPYDPSPVHLLGGGYMMAFAINPTNPVIPTGGQYRLATSDDGFTWTVNPTVLAEGGTSCLVETADGTLYFYYGQ